MKLRYAIPLTVVLYGFILWGFVNLLICDPLGSEYTGKKRLNVSQNSDVLVWERQVEYKSMCKITGIQRVYAWVREGDI